MTSVSRLTYLDTSALMRRAEGLASPCSRRNVLIAPFIQQILDDTSRELACSELTLIEFHSNLTANLRSADLPGCDSAWWDNARTDLFQRIGEGRIAVLQTPPRSFEHVMALISSATLNHNRALRAWDALHATIASRWSYSVGAHVELVTSDSDFDLMPKMTGLASRIAVLNLDVAASTGEGADRSR